MLSTPIQLREKLVASIKLLITASLIVYLSCIIGLLVLWEVAPEHHALIRLLNIFALYLFVPLLGLPLVAAWWRSWRVGAVVAAGCIILFLLVFGAHILPSFSRPQASPALRVVSFNQLFSNGDVPHSLNLLLEQDADVIALQELSDAMVQELAHYQQQYPYQILYPDSGPGGMGLVSRHPILHQEVLNTGGFDFLRVVVDVDGQPVTLLNVHPVPPQVGLRMVETPFSSVRLPLPVYDTSLRDQQLAYILALVRTTDGPLIVAGDLNTSEREPIYRSFAALHDAYGESAWGFGFTYPSGQYSRLRSLLKVRIDYILSSDELVPVSARVNCEARESDHCMVIADLGWNLDSAARQRHAWPASLLHP